MAAALIGRVPSEEIYAQVLSAFQATPRKTIIAENSIHTIKPIAAASPPVIRSEKMLDRAILHLLNVNSKQ